MQRHWQAITTFRVILGEKLAKDTSYGVQFPALGSLFPDFFCVCKKDLGNAGYSGLPLVQHHSLTLG